MKGSICLIPYVTLNRLDSTAIIRACIFLSRVISGIKDLLNTRNANCTNRDPLLRRFINWILRCYILTTLCRAKLLMKFLCRLNSHLGPNFLKPDHSISQYFLQSLLNVHAYTHVAKCGINIFFCELNFSFDNLVSQLQIKSSSGSLLLGSLKINNIF